MNTNLKKILIALMLLAPSFALSMERPPQPPKKLPTFMEMVQQEEKRQAFIKMQEAEKQQELRALQKRKDYIDCLRARITSLPPDVRSQILITYCLQEYPSVTDLWPLHPKETEKRIVSLKDILTPETLLRLFQSLPPIAHHIYHENELFKALVRAQVPAMQDARVLNWAAQIRGAELSGLFNRDCSHLAADLLKEGCVNINWQNPDGRTALLETARHYDTRAMQSLLTHHADPNIPDNEGVTPLIQVAIPKGYKHPTTDLEMINILLAGSADPNLQDNNGLTALAWTTNPEIVQKLLQANANPNIADREKITPLMWAIQAGETEKAKLLIAAGADLNLKDDLGETALDWAQRHNRIEIIELIKNAMAKKENEKLLPPSSAQ